MPYRSPSAPYAPPSKPCAFCGKQFARPVGYSDSQWDERRFCSTSCGVRGGQRERSGGLTEFEGRLWITCRDKRRYAFARGVMEAHLRRPLHPDEIVHHINGDPRDDRIENLQLTDRAEHMRIHHPELEAAQRASRRAA